jgi:2'-phosphotransferase
MADSDHETFAERTEDIYLSGRGGKRGGGRGKGQGRGGARGKAGGRAENREVQVSKALSKLLRHQAQNAGLGLDTEGFARLDQVVGSHFPHRPVRLVSDDILI